jgi:hypothetical protein
MVEVGVSFGLVVVRGLGVRGLGLRGLGVRGLVAVVVVVVGGVGNMLRVGAVAEVDE